MPENLNELYSNTNFIITGGALKTLTDFLNARRVQALVVEKVSADTLNVLDAAGVAPTSLTLKDNVSELFSSGIVKQSFEIGFANGNNEWPGVVRIRGANWTIYLLLKKSPESPDAFIKELEPCAGLIGLWQTVKTISETEKKLSRLSYMILATKSTLASIFEPMPLQYFASFIADVVKESLFPKSVVILRDDGKNLTVFNGKADVIPSREGFYASQILPPTPIVTKKDSPVEVVLPIAEGDCRLFCLMQWDNLPDEQTMNFLELLGNLAVRAIAINALRQKSNQTEANISNGEFTVLSLSNVLKIIRGAENKEKFFSLLVDIFKEQSRMNNCVLVTWDKSLNGYTIAENRTGHSKAAPDSTVLKTSAVPSEKIAEPSYDTAKQAPDAIFKSWGLADCPWKETMQASSMKYIFPACDDDSLVGFIALGAGQEGRLALDRSQLASMQLIAQFAAYEFKRFE